MDQYEYDESDFNLQCTSSATNTPQLSKFDIKLREGWDRALDNGHFRYKLNLETKIIGDKNYVAQLNEKRAQERRKPDEINTVNQPFNPATFNFTKIKKDEILFELVKKRKCTELLTNGCAENSAVERTERKRHLVIINVSPLEYGHTLLVPDVDACRPQILTEESIQLSIECMLLSKHRGLRVGFNSLCAFASVNHLHVHAYYLEEEMFIESAPVERVCDNLYELVCLPVKGFAFQLHGCDLQKLSRMIYKISDHFQQNEIAHNLFMTRGPVFGESRPNSDTIRIFLWARKKVIGVKDTTAFNVALVELAGHLPIKVKELYETLDQKMVEDTMMKDALDEEDYDRVKEAVKNICEQSDTSL